MGAVLAMYDFSAKQSYIYRTNAIKEIVGASQLIKEAFSGFLDLIVNKLGLELAERDILLNKADIRPLGLKLDNESTSFPSQLLTANHVIAA